MSRKTSRNEHFTKPKTTLELDSLPDFMKSPNPQVKFHSAFPPLTTKVRVRGVMERAGFDVYKPDNSRSVSGKSPTINDLSHDRNDSGQFHPPNRFHANNRSASSNNSASSSPRRPNGRSVSHNNLRNQTVSSLPTKRNDSHDSNLSATGFSNPAGKTRNFTAAPATSSSTPDLLNSFDTHNTPADANNSPTSVTKKKNSILSYARQKLNISKSNNNLSQLQVDSTPQNIPDLALPVLSRNPTIHAEAEQLENTQPVSGLDIHYPDDYSNRNPYEQEELVYERQVPSVGGPRPYVDTETIPQSDDISFNFQSEQQPFIPIENEQVDYQQYEQQQYPSSNTQQEALIPDILIESQSIIETSPTPISDSNQLNIPQNNQVLQSPGRSARSSRSSSIGSFDEKFMLQQNENNDESHNLSQDTLGGLNGLRNTINSTEVDHAAVPVVPEVTSPYNNAKRISTLSTKDTKIYNLQSLDESSANGSGASVDYVDANNYVDVNEMTVIQEGESEYSRSIQERYSQDKQNVQHIIPDVAIEEEEGILGEENLQSLGNGRIPSMDNGSSVGGDALFEDAHEGYVEEQPQADDVYSITENDQLLRRGFTKRKASTVETPNSLHEPVLPKSEVPELPTGISDLINDIDNFQNDGSVFNNQASGAYSENNESSGFDIPPRHFEKSPQNPDSETNSYSEHEHDHGHLHPHHPYASLSQSSYSQSVVSAPLRMSSSGFTTPDKETSYENNVENGKNISVNVDINGKQSVYYPPGEGPCRKCGDIILKKEKKIWSKDNQLSGQWHRSCFGCNTCGAKFNKGSSCYVYGDQPYCERHFHELNGSLCQVCNKGVEGECLQNEVNEVFHIDCLKCVICGLNVTGDYFIFRDEVMCEDDAKELMYQIEEAEKEYKGKDVDKIIKRRTRVLYL